MKTELFHSCSHCWVFQICWHIDAALYHDLKPFRNWNSSAGITSSSLTLFIVMLPKAHLTSDSRMPGSRWVIIPLLLSVSLRFCCIILPCILMTNHLLLLGPYNFCLLLCPSLHKMFPWYLIFLKKLLVFPILLFYSNSLHLSFRKAFLSLLAILWNSAFR